MKLAKSEVLNLNQQLEAMNNLRGVRFSYFVAKNINKLKSEVEAMQKAAQSSQEFLEFDIQRAQLAEKHAEKDKDGKPIQLGNMYDIRNKDKFNKEWEALKTKHKEVIKTRDKQVEEYNSMLKEEAEYDLHKIDIADVPEEISAGQMKAIFDLVNEK